jgi:molecular chaperone GrpE
MSEEVNKSEEEVVEETVQENQDTEAKKEAEEEKNEKSTEDLLQEERDKFLRLFAEFENYKKRTSKERIDLFKTASSELMSALLPVQDDFQRALEQLKLSADQEILQGVELIQNKFKEVLKAKGLVHIEVSTGDDFNADIHEAITQIPAPSPELAGKIVDVVEQGYKLGERILRHPKVVVGKS